MSGGEGRAASEGPGGAPRWIRLEIEPPLATIVLDRPEKLNAWSWESARQIAAHADALRFDDRVRVVLVRAEGRAFCAGVDLGMPEDRITGRSPPRRRATTSSASAGSTSASTSCPPCPSPC